MFSRAVRLLPPKGSGEMAVLKARYPSTRPLQRSAGYLADLKRIVARRLPVSACGR
jgi:hypothetical protein